MRLTILLLFVFKCVEIQSLGSETKTGRGFQTKIIPGRGDNGPTVVVITPSPSEEAPTLPPVGTVCDDKKSYCKADAFKCMDPNYYFNCRKSCGCRGNCHDVSANCIMWPAGCLEYETSEKCSRFCGFCEGCNDVFKEELCQKLVRYCYNENVGYFCSKTCNKCRCQDRLKYNSVCRLFKKYGYCNQSTPYYYFMKFSCAVTCEYVSCKRD
ncbi:uncharacterized protein [Lepeophtheirus salmonis]|uniref:uncharacterized protein isoform X1 n=1 Tax=Lepeophtheirus salmonis TaxID=72036 RepID=UPI001AE7D22D|nr:uncharacterized protein LOC121114152 isoform X1 [Lepeophtheirus salmonis]